MLFLGFSCSGNDNILPDEKETENENLIVEPVTSIIAEVTNKANELNISWSNSMDIASVELLYVKDKEGETQVVTENVRVFGGKKTSHLVRFPEYATYKIEAVAIDNYGNRSRKVTITGTPAREDAATIYEIIENKLPIADPYILYNNGKYYAYGTRINGFEVYTSIDLKHWKRRENLALLKENSWGTRWYWAPEVSYVDSKNRFYMFYTVDEHVCVASSNSPEGPFLQTEKKPIFSTEKTIDPSLFIDDDGKIYLYFVRFTGGNVIWVAEMNNDLESIKAETLTKCITAERPWEKIQGTIAEGPSVFRRGNTYYLTYSANHFESQDYGVGYATSSSPKGPWTKYSGNPLLRRDKPAAAGLIGTGHGAPFVTADGSYKYIYHAHASSTSVGPRSSFINNYNISNAGVISITGEPIRPVLVE